MDALYKELNNTFFPQRPVSITAVSRAVRNEAGYTLKRLHEEPEAYNNEQRIQERKEWCQKILALGGKMIDGVYIDESGFNLHLARRVGRAPRGKRAIQIRPTQRGRNVSVAIAVAREGIIEIEARLGSYNTDKYIDFIKNKVRKLN